MRCCGFYSDVLCLGDRRGADAVRRADPVALRTYCYLRFNIVILKRRVQKSRKRWSYLNVLLKSVLSCVCCALRRCEVWFSLSLTDALDISIIVQQ